MMNLRKPSSALMLSLVSLAVCGGLSAQAATAPSAKVVVSKQADVQGRRYQFEKALNEHGDLVERVTHNGRAISVVPAAEVERIEPRLAAWLATAADNATVEVNVALRDMAPFSAESTQEGQIDFAAGQMLRQRHNGRDASVSEMASINAQEDARVRAHRKNSQLAQGRMITALAKRHGLSGRAEWRLAAEKGQLTVQSKMSAAMIKSLIAQGDVEIAGIEMAFPVKDQINNAMNDTNITDWALPFNSTRGAGIGIYYTEIGCRDEAGASNYDRLAGSQTDHSQNVFGILRAVAPASYIYCRGSAVLPELSDLDGVGGNPAIRIINRSNGGNDSTSYSTLDRDWDQFAYTHALAIFNAAGNFGNETGNVISPAKGHNVMGVGNYNDANDTINSGSSFVNPQTKNAKPEFAAPGTSITAGGFTMTGTSMASPHAAGFAADLMSAQPAYVGRPHLVYAAMIAGATDAIAGGADRVGAGGIDFLSTHYNGSTWYWQGNNASFEGFDSGDGSDDGYIEKVVNIDQSWANVRIAIAWMNRGTWTYDHRNDAHPIGQDLDLTVVGPNGVVIGTSASYDNAFEIVNFDPTVTGNYKIRIKRFANRDTSADFRLGLKVNLW